MTFQQTRHTYFKCPQKYINKNSKNDNKKLDITLKSTFPAKTYNQINSRE